MHQPQIEPGNSITDYQEALNNLPSGVKGARPNYEWNLAEGFSMTWQYSGDSLPANQMAADRYLVPGTKEPHYLEGPTKGDIWGTGWAENSFFGEGFRGSALQQVKRDSSNEAGNTLHDT
ncbi:hypothetical protein TWF281_008922 [Arthrobotrys megalospora]